MLEFQTHLIFPTHAVPAAGPVPPGTERLQIEAPGKVILHGLHISPSGKGEGEGTTILGFGGNAWNAEDVGSYLHEVYPGADIVVFHYRGYRPSTGSPSSEALLADAPLVYDAAAKLTPNRRIVAVGFSIGSGIAAQLAGTRKLDGMILVTPFDSLKAVAQSMYPWLPIGPFFDHEIDAVSAIADLDLPVAVIAAQRDEIVPSERTDALRGRIGRLEFDRTIARAGHNDIYARSDFQAAMREALAIIYEAEHTAERTHAECQESEQERRQHGAFHIAAHGYHRAGDGALNDTQPRNRNRQHRCEPRCGRDQKCRRYIDRRAYRRKTEIHHDDREYLKHERCRAQPDPFDPQLQNASKHGLEARNLWEAARQHTATLKPDQQWQAEQPRSRRHDAETHEGSCKRVIE